MAARRLAEVAGMVESGEIRALCRLALGRIALAKHDHASAIEELETEEGQWLRDHPGAIAHNLNTDYNVMCKELAA